MKALRASAGRLAIAGSTTSRHTEVFERVRGSRARNSTQGVTATQSAMTLVFASARAISACKPPTPFAQPSDEAIQYALQSFTAGRPVLAAARDLTQRIFTDFRYDATATEVFTPVAAVMQKRAGVCQDFAHLQIAMLRGLGLAARYVSGYIRTLKAGDDPESGLRGADASHAWLSVWCGPDDGWIDLDPTNNLVCSDEHVVAAIGRDYGDISPVRGVVLGGGPHRIGVAVELLPQV